MLLTVLAGAVLLSVDPIGACIASSDRAQQLRDERLWVLASKELLACSQEICPKPVRANCQKWRAELEQAMPSVLVQVQADGQDAPESKVMIDDRPVELVGTAIPLGPGAHVFAATLGRRAVSLRMLILEGEKNRKVMLALEPEPPPELVSVVPARVRLLPAGPFVLGGVSLVSFGLFAGLGLDGKARLASLEANPCAASRTCDVTAVNGIKSQYLVADALLVTAISAAVFALVWAIIASASAD